MTSVLVAIPVLNRPQNVQPLLASLRRTEGDTILPFFLVSPGDQAEIEAVEQTGERWVEVLWQAGPGDYARKINFAAGHYDCDWIFMGADDLHFHPYWLDQALRVADKTGNAVIGTNDLGNPLVKAGRHAVHSLVRHDYVERGTIDEPGKLLHEGYSHNWVDNEFVETAKSRGEFVSARRSVVEHLHPVWRGPGGIRKAEMDSTYALGQAGYRADHELFMERRRLWQPELKPYRRRYRR